MEIVKKSLEESKSTPPIVPDTPSTSPNMDIPSISAATDLLALVQASIQSTSANPISDVPKADVVTSNTQPRSFGDVNPIETLKPLIPGVTGNQPMQGVQQQTPFNQNQRPSHNRMNVGGNRNITPWERDNTMVNNNMQMNNMMQQDNQGPMNNCGPTNNIECIDNTMRNAVDNRGPMDNRGSYNRGPMFGQDSFNQGPRGNFQNGPKQDNYDTRPLLNQPFGNQGGNQPFGNQPFGNQGNNQQFGNQQFGNQGNNQQFGNQGGNQPFGNQGNNPQFGNQGGNQRFSNQGGNQRFGNRGRGRGMRGRGRGFY
uniref:Uncharacterized protein n=1 Tax=Pectinophora gossypiella TaxID=13191 RepID=A0A1E1W5P0_PECGO